MYSSPRHTNPLSTIVGIPGNADAPLWKALVPPPTPYAKLSRDKKFWMAAWPI